MNNTSQSQIPPLHLQSPAVDFIENSLDKYHPAFSMPPSQYDPYLGGFVIQQPESALISRPTPAITVIEPQQNAVQSPESCSAVATSPTPGQLAEVLPPPRPRPTPNPVDAFEFWDLLFPQAMKMHIAAHPQEPELIRKAGQGIRTKTDWTGVLDQIEKERNDYTKVNGGFRAGFRKVYRAFNDHVADPLHRATKLVPGGGDLGAVAVTPIIGCIQILLEAARASSKVQKTMVDAFDDVDNMFTDIELYRQMYPGDKNIEKASVDLIASTLFAAENVIAFFLKGTAKKFLSAAIKRENYEQSTIDNLTAIKTQCESLLREVEHTHKFQMANATNVLTAVQADVQQMPHELRNLMRDLFNDFERRRRIQEEEFQRQVLLQQEEYNRRVATLYVAAVDAYTRPASPAALPAPGLQQLFHSHELLAYLDIPDTLPTDIQQLQDKRKFSVSEPDQARAEQLIRTKQLQHWLITPNSSQLLVHGSYDRRAYISGLSLFCMTLRQMLTERSPCYISLLFLCGLHTERLMDQNTGGRAIIKSFIQQLLCQHEFTDISLSVEALEDLQRGNIQALCWLFGQLIRILPRTVAVFCIVDGVMYYERDDFVESFGNVLLSILQLSQDGGAQAPVKVLLTSPMRTAVVKEMFPDDKILSMDGMVRAGLVASDLRLGREMGSQLV